MLRCHSQILSKFQLASQELATEAAKSQMFAGQTNHLPGPQNLRTGEPMMLVRW